MTRKDYIEVAKILNKRFREVSGQEESSALLDTFVDDFSELFANDNPNFDKQRFESAVYC